ncbi:MAG TPA: protein-L-isoaspartate(D-aspartate) O-methyltransferase, partial [Candidatus Kapabacteria bacterium]|nr:protein-L-isoaspartate(D-aspartate) O-methyltransferase [Candidatus Kapabacteria bacterium]
QEMLVEELRLRGIKNERVLEAMASVDREAFVPTALRPRAYEDIALPIDCMQTISQPYTVAFMTELLDVQRGIKVLEIGTGSGYQAAVLCAMGARVFTIERHAPLLLEARRILEKLGYNVATKIGDGTVGWSEFAPFDRIIVTAGAPQIPDALVKQLNVGGRLVVPVGSLETQKLILVEKKEEGVMVSEWNDFKFVPLVGKGGWEGSVEKAVQKKY